MKKTPRLSYGLLAAATLLPLASVGLAQNSAAPAPAATANGWQKPAWLTDLSAGVKESYDDNVLMVSGDGMKAKSSWISTVSPKVGVNVAPLLGHQTTLSALTLVYAPDFAALHNFPSESYDAHKISDSVKGKTGDLSYSLDNAFLYNDGDSVAPTYTGNDKNRSAYATAFARERLNQVQDRSTIVFQYDVNKFFLRPTASLLYYNLMTDWRNVSGYQNYASRSDVNGGLDLGYKVVPNVAVTVGYRYGSQYQQALPASVDTSSSATVNGRRTQSSSDYQRVLVGVEGQPWSWLTVKAAGGPDFRVYNAAAPVPDDNAIDYYGEGALVATLSARQNVSFTYKHWEWVSSTGKCPYADSTYALNYHVSATPKLGLDLGAKWLESDYTSGAAKLTGNSSLRDDAEYSFTAGVSYAVTPHLSASLTYGCDLGRNRQDLPASLATTVGFRQFDHQQVSLGVAYKF